MVKKEAKSKFREVRKNSPPHTHMHTYKQHMYFCSRPRDGGQLGGWLPGTLSHHSCCHQQTETRSKHTHRRKRGQNKVTRNTAYSGETSTHLARRWKARQACDARQSGQVPGAAACPEQRAGWEEGTQHVHATPAPHHGQGWLPVGVMHFISKGLYE